MTDPLMLLPCSLVSCATKDPQTLSDGRRWVDVEALRPACLHLAEEVRHA
jgi:hypothetical protein